MTLQERFEDAQRRVKTLTSPPAVDTLLSLYGLYKQGAQGDADGKRPGMLDIKARAKYDAWAGHKSKTRDQAMEAYVALVDQILKTK